MSNDALEKAVAFRRDMNGLVEPVDILQHPTIESDDELFTASKVSATLMLNNHFRRTKKALHDKFLASLNSILGEAEDIADTHTFSLTPEDIEELMIAISGVDNED